MDKKEALKILIGNSSLISDDIRSTLLEKVATFSEEEVEALGMILSKEQELASTPSDVELEVLDAAIKHVDEEIVKEQ